MGEKHDTSPQRKTLRVLKMPVGLKSEEVTGGWKKQHNEKLHNLYLSNIIKVIESRRMNKWGMEKMGRSTYRSSVWKCGRKKPIGKP
jgi:hypothetical protein